jgi:hypothetical protein
MSSQYANSYKSKPYSMLDMKNIIVRGDKTYLVSTVDIGSELAAMTDYRFETMVFPCDSHGTVTDYVELYNKRYAAKTNAMRGHAAAIEGFQPEE